MPTQVDRAVSEADALRWDVEPEFFRPDYTRALPCVFPTIFQLLGSPMEGYPTLAHVLPDASRSPVRRVFLLCIDAFGFKEMAVAPRIAALYERYGAWITSVFPSITSCALTSIYQGLPPERHGLLGHNIWKDSPGAVVDLLRMQVVGAKASLADAGFDLEQWKREPGILEDGAGVPGFHLMPAPIVNSGLSTYTYGKARRVGYIELPHGFSKAARMLSDLETGWVGLYTSLVDTLSHVLGDEAPQMGLAARYIEQCAQWLAGALPEAVARETALVVVGDHGQAATRERIPLYGPAGEWLEQHTRAVGYSGRVMHVYLGGHPEPPVRRHLEGLLGGRGVVLDWEVARTLIGPAGGDDWARRSLGDLVVVLREGVNWEKRAPDDEPYATRLMSQHGAMSWDEMVIPFLCAPLTALLGE